MLFASLLSNLIQGVMTLVAIGVIAYFAWRMKQRPAPHLEKDSSVPPTPPSDHSESSDNFQTPDEIADDLSASLSDVSDAIDDGSRLDVGNLDDVSGVSAVPYTANVVEDVTENADNAADGFAEETFEITESIEADSAIDDVFDDAEPFAEAPVNNPFATPSDAVPPSSASLPPVRESASSPTSSSFPTASPSQGTTSIPPRRYGLDAKPKPSPLTPPAPPTVWSDSEDEPDEIEVLNESATIGLSAFSGGAAESDADELADLRLALEASHNELSHLTSQRNQAVSRADQHEEELGKLRRQLHDLGAAQEAMQQDRQKVTVLESELADLRSQLSEATTSSSELEQTEYQHEAAINELRLILGQREAAEASLARERDNLAAQNEELQRKLDNIESDSDPVDDSISNQLASLELQHQQAGAELSLANETVRQLNQNMNQRDGELMNLRHQVHSLTQQIEEIQAEATETDESALQEIQSQHEAALTEMRVLLEEREASTAELLSQNNELKEKNAELESGASDNSALQEIQSQHEAALTEMRVLLEEREASTAELSSQNDALQARVTELESAEAESSTAIDPSHEAELSLANETIRLLNQGLTQRDAQIIDLRREQQTWKTQLEEARNAHQDTSVVEESAEEISELQQQLGELEEARDQIRQELEQAQQSCAELEVDLNRHRTEFAAAREKLHEELASAKKEQQTVAEVLEVAKNQVADQALVIEQLRDERTALRSQASSMNPVEIEKLTAQRDEALARYDKLQIDFAHAVKGNEEVSAEDLEAMRQKLKEKSADYHALQAELHTLKVRFEAENGALRSRLESLAVKPASVSEDDQNESETGDVDTDTSSRIAELEAEIEQQEQYASGLQTERQDLLDRLGAAQEEIDAKSTEMRRMREHLEEAKTVAQEIADQKQAFTDLQLAEQELTQVVDTRNAELKRLQDEQIEIKQQLAHFIDAEEVWKNERISLLANAGLDEDGEPIETAESTERTTDTTAAQQQIELLETSLSERDEALRVLNERFAELKQLYDNTDEVSVLHDDASDIVDGLRVERDQAAAAAAEASAKIGELMTEIHQLKSDRPADQSDELTKLQEENREYRRSVAELHAVANELEEIKLDRGREQDSSRQRLLEATRANAELSAEVLELKRSIGSDASQESSAPSQELLDELSALKKQSNDLIRERDAQAKAIAELQSEIESTPQDKKEGVQAVRNAKNLAAKLESQEKKLRERDDRLQDLAAQLSKMRTEATSLKNVVAEQQAIVRALSKGDASSKVTATSEQNGRAPATDRAAKKKVAAKKVATKKVTSNRAAKKKTVKKKATVSRKAAAPKKATSATPKKRPAKVDDLKQILGIGPVLEKRLNKIGVYQFAQVKAWSKATIAKIDEELELGGRIEREKWIAQAKKLASSKTAN